MQYFLVSIPGSDLKNIFVLRSIEDAHAIDEQLGEETHVAILGVSFIGMEAAAYCVKKVEKVTVIGRDAYPLRAFGQEVGERLMEYFEEKDVNFMMNNGIKSSGKLIFCHEITSVVFITNNKEQQFERVIMKKALMEDLLFSIHF